MRTFVRLLQPDEGRQRLDAHGNRLASELINRLGATDGPGCPRGPQALGVAHGWAGLVYSLLTWSSASGAALPDVTSVWLTQLQAQAQIHGDAACWERQFGSREFWGGWCNGSAGFVHLFLLAASVLRDRSYIGWAERAGLHAFAAPGAGATLCCGQQAGVCHARIVAGYPEPDVWLSPARLLAEASLAVGGTSLDHGRAGAEALAADLENPELARMPLFELRPGPF